MIDNTWIFDCEVFAYDWIFVFQNLVTQNIQVFHNDNDGVAAFMEYAPFLGGFNNKHYDNHILKAVLLGLTPEEIKEINDLIIQEGVNGWDLPHVVSPKTVGQFTGLTDKNGVKIFEGDIVQFHMEAIGMVVFCDGAKEPYDTGYCVKWTTEKHLRNELGYWANIRGLEVIGNIHDNPELLKESAT